MRLFLVAAVGACMLLPGTARAQASNCRLNQDRSGEVTRSESGGSFIYSVKQVIIDCEGGVQIRADEANIFEATRESHLYGNVVFQDPEQRLTSDNAVYNSAFGRLLARGNVFVTNRITQSTLRGPEVEYYRALPERPQAQLIAPQRPHLTVVPEEGETDREPLEIDGDRVVIQGENLSAFGNVIIRRSDLDANANEARYDRTAGTLNLRGSARVKGEQYDLRGETIDALAPAGAVESLTAETGAELASEDLTVRSEQLRLFFADSLLNRLVASSRGAEEGSRAQVQAPGFELLADSIEALTPNQQLSRVLAIGNARGEAIDTVPSPALPVDSAAEQTIALDRDWITGDTVTGDFLPADSAGGEAAGSPPGSNVRLDRLSAQGSARSLYRVRAEGRPADARPALNFLAGDAILLSFAAGELSVANVTGLEQGVYFDPEIAAPVATPAVPAAPAVPAPR